MFLTNFIQDKTLLKRVVCEVKLVVQYGVILLFILVNLAISSGMYAAVICATQRSNTGTFLYMPTAMITQAEIFLSCFDTTYPTIGDSAVDSLGGVFLWLRR
jgi:hypothetical protein